MSDLADVAALEQVLVDIENQLAQLGPEQAAFVRNARLEREKRKQEREALMAKCHPDGGHWPPHEECPACQKLLQMVENKAKERCKNPEDMEELEKHFWDVMKEKYGIVVKD